VAASPVSGWQCIYALGKLGYSVARTRGGHARLQCDQRPPVTIPLQTEIDRALLRSILKTVTVSEADFLALL
jgi:predicted RNA binding protein YcfA (HicA-like mRNA interferase family)